MEKIKLTEATSAQAPIVASLVSALLLELEPEVESEIKQLALSELTSELIDNQKVFAVLATDGGKPVGVLTLHECAAIYAGGLFGEISELYVVPEYRSQQVGQLLIEAALKKAETFGWKRLEVGSPPAAEWPRSIKFYERNGFTVTGSRLRCLI